MFCLTVKLVLMWTLLLNVKDTWTRIKLFCGLSKMDWFVTLATELRSQNYTYRYNGSKISSALSEEIL